MVLEQAENNLLNRHFEKKVKKKKVSEQEINEKYEKGEQRILIEMNREKLPSFAESLEKTNYIEKRPFYQRRERWNAEKKSKLIESFLINVPVPPLILYETSYNSYEVMDGQQRITAIEEFYNNTLKLTGLELWPELEGMTYENLPKKIKAGIDRRSISTIVVITESTSNQNEALFLKQLVFERLNTGGIALSPQEIRNCIYSGKFNDLLLQLSNNRIFAKAWKIPIDEEKKKENGLYKNMGDVELILRFFALRNLDKLKGNLKELLDCYMKESLLFSDEEINNQKIIFQDTISLLNTIYDDNLFKPFDVKKKLWKTQSYKVYYDALMVSFSNNLSQKNELIDKKLDIIQETKNIFIQDSEGLSIDGKKLKKNLLTGEGSTQADFKARIQIFDSLIKKII